MSGRSGSARRRRLWLFGALTLAVMVVIFCMSAADGTESGSLSDSLLGTVLGRLLEALTPASWGLSPETAIRKGAHMFEFFCLAVSAFLFLRELLGGLALPGLGAWGWSVFYAATDEWHQTFVPGRAGLASDVLIDALGALIGTLLAVLIAALLGKGKERRTKTV